MIFDPRPFFVRRFHRKMEQDEDPKSTYLTGWVILLVFLAALALFPDWLVITVFVLYFISALLKPN